jgi:hypothetical protein
VGGTRKFVFEPLEPRVLLSADPVSADISASLLGEQTAAAIVQQADAATSPEITIAWPEGGEPVAWDGVGPGGPASGANPDDDISGATAMPTVGAGPEGAGWNGIGPGGPAGGSPDDGGISGGPTSTGGGETWDGIGPGGPGAGGGSMPTGDGSAGASWNGIGPGGPTGLIDPDDLIRTGETPPQSTPFDFTAQLSESSRSILGDDSMPSAPAPGETQESALPEQSNPSFDDGLAELLRALESGVWQLSPEPFVRIEPTATLTASSAFDPAALDALFARLVAAQRAQGAATKDVAAPRVLIGWQEMDRGSESLRFLLRFN